MTMIHTSPIYKEYPRFRFPGYVSEGTCFLRACSSPSGLVVLCSQLLDYHCTSVTNATEQIVTKAIQQLQQDIGLDHLVSKKRWWQLRADPMDVARQILKRTAWIEHYPAGSELSPAGSLAFVAFDSELRPVWNFVSREDAARECGVELAFFDIDAEQLKHEQ